MAKVLKTGDSGAEVKKLQTALNDAGAKPKLKTDGKFGPATAEAVKAFQKEKKLKPDGIAGKGTMDALSNNSANPKGEAEELKRLEAVLEKFHKLRDESEKGFDKMEADLDRQYKKVTKYGEKLDLIAMVSTAFVGAGFAGKDLLKGAAAKALPAVAKEASILAGLEVAVGLASPSKWADKATKLITGEDNETAYKNAVKSLQKTKGETLKKLDQKIGEYERLVKDAGAKK